MANPEGIGGQKAGEPGRNPKGNNGRVKGWTPWENRLVHFLNKPVDELEALTKDANLLKKRPMIDVIALNRVKNMYEGANTLKETEASLDRIQGKPPQPFVGDDGFAPIRMAGEITDEELEEIARGQQEADSDQPE